MLITWLHGKMRIKGPKYTQEVEGYRCSFCNTFQTSQRRTCPICKGEYKGKIVPKHDVKIEESDEGETD